jgi:proline dehydrogenase
MAIEIVEQYRRLINIIPEIIEASGFRNDFIAKKLGMKPQNFSVKKQRGNWSVDEVEKLLNVVDNEDVEEFIMMEIMKSRENDETISYDEYKAEIATWK